MTYLGLAGIFLAIATVPTVAALVLRRARRPWWVVTGVLAAMLVVLTLVFDNLMIAVDLYRYADDASVRLIGGAPVEDLAWPVAAALLLPALWILLPDTRAHGRRGAGELQDDVSPGTAPSGRGARR